MPRGKYDLNLTDGVHMNSYEFRILQIDKEGCLVRNEIITPQA